MYHFIHCSRKYIEHVNFNQLTFTLSVSKNGQIMNETKLT